MLLIQGVTSSSSCMGISITVRDTRSVKLCQSCTFWCLIICRLENRENPNTSWDIREKPKNCYFVFIFFWHYGEIGNTFALPFFRLNKIAFTDLQYNVSVLKNHHQLYFFKYGPVFFIIAFNTFLRPKFNNLLHLS